MDIIDSLKIVQFGNYCPTCKYRKCVQSEEPCNSCLEEPARINSRVPAKYEEAKRVFPRVKRKGC